MLKLRIPSHVMVDIPVKNAEKILKRLLEKHGFDFSKEIYSWFNPFTMDYEYTQYDVSTTDVLSVVDTKDILFLFNEHLGTFVSDENGGN